MTELLIRVPTSALHLDSLYTIHFFYIAVLNLSVPSVLWQSCLPVSSSSASDPGAASVSAQNAVLQSVQQLRRAAFLLKGELADISWSVSTLHVQAFTSEPVTEPPLNCS